MTITLEPVGRVRGGRTEAVDDDWGAVEAAIVLDDGRFGPEATAGLEGFSHLQVVYLFDRVDPAAVVTGARHPRHNPDWPAVGIFAQRARLRPNRLGVSSCELVAVDGLRLAVRGLDAVDGTPVLDVKPYVAAMEPRTPVRQPPWMDELMAGYWSAPAGS